MAIKSVKRNKDKKELMAKNGNAVPSSLGKGPKPFSIQPSFAPEKFSSFQEFPQERKSRQESSSKDITFPAKEAFLDNSELPAIYNATYITLIARDPYWIYAYWEIAPSSLEELRHKIGSDLGRSAYVLRMYDVTCIDFNGNNANHWFDVEVGPHTNNWYINLMRDNVSYCAEIGLRAPDGRFFALSRSNFVHTPRASSSSRSEVVWMERKDDAPCEPPFVMIESEGKKSRAVRNNCSRALNNPRRRIFLTDDDIKAYYSKLFPLLRNILSKRSGLRRSYRFNLKNGVSLDEFLLRGLSKKQLMKRIPLGASEEMVISEGGSESIHSAREEKKHKFFFEVATELIVYGRTETGAEVWLKDKKIKLRSDGTFTLRFALPDGRIPLDFTAISSNKVDKRKAVTLVERAKTVYEP